MSGERWHESTEVCVSCPDCAFTFDSAHTDGNGFSYSCPACAEARLATELAEAREREERLREALEPSAETRDYLTRTIATIRNHRDADNCWPQWANYLADEVERVWAALAPEARP